ncbi:MAG: ABC transporter ATP-binding protein [Clostridia bacterium]|nr:ABC transporter ATP-binding protein [Clostridia bacterium]
MEQAEKPKRSSLTSKVIPDYDHIFEPSNRQDKGKKEPKLFRKLLKANARPLATSTLIYFIQALPVWIIPLITANIINIVTEAVGLKEVPSALWWELGVNALIMLLVIAQNVPSTVWRSMVVSKMLRRNSAGMKSAVVRKLQSLMITYHKDMQTGKIQSKFLRDTELVDQMMGVTVNTLIPQIFNVVFAVAISVYRNWVVALFFLLIVPLNLLITRAFRKKVRKNYHDFRINSEDMSSKLTTMLTMMQVTKSHGLEQKEISSLENSIERVAGSGIKVDKTHAFFGASAYVVSHIMSLINLVFCSVMAIFDQINVGDIVLYQSMYSQINAGVSALINSMHPMSAGFDALSSLSEVMNATEVEMNIGKSKVPSIKGGITFEDVYYKYPNTDNYVIKGLSLDVKPGECVAFVGPSGSGKSTIMNIIIGFLIAQQGDMKVDGKSIKDCNLTEYRHHISVVPQNSILFSGSIRDNITYGLEKYSEQELQKVVEMANLKEFVDELPNGLDTIIGEHGDKLSGGQKQRVTIARALIRNPQILILDEATSALDNISEFHVQKAISSSIKGRTTFIVAHRLSTIRNADRIVVMDNGKAVEMGTYDELMAKKGKFYELKCLNDMNQKTADEALA